MYGQAPQLQSDCRRSTCILFLNSNQSGKGIVRASRIYLEVSLGYLSPVLGMTPFYTLHAALDMR